MNKREIFRADALPVLQNRVYATAAEAKACATGDVVLVQDMRTGLIFNDAFDLAKIRYDEHYQNEQACSGSFRQHLDAVTDIARRYFGSRKLIEIGCGKGYFLEHLAALGYDITGVDPAYEGNNPRVIKAPFNHSLGLTADGIVLRHVLEHIPDPLTFLSTIARGNGGKGLIYIEVPCFDWVHRNRAWFDIYYEHVNYFRLADFHRMFGSVADSGHLFGGQYIYAVAELSSLRNPVCDERPVDLPVDFLEGISGAARVVKAGVARNVVWGAASKGVIFSIYMGRNGANIDFAIDINPAKQDRYLAVSGLAVLSPESARTRLQGNDSVFVMNPNYFDEIVAQFGGEFKYRRVGHE